MRLVRGIVAVVLVVSGIALIGADPAPALVRGDVTVPVDDGGGGGNRAILVAGSTSPPAGDIAIRDLILDRGFDLTIVDDDSDLDSLDLTDVGLLAISTSVTPGKVGDVLADAPVPIITWEAVLFDDLALSSSRETTTRYRTIDVVDPSHPIAAGRGPGPVSVYSVAKTLSYGEPAAAAAVIAHVPSNPGQATVFAYEEGDRLVDGSTAPAARVALFPSYAGARRLTDHGSAIIGAAIDWATASSPGPTAPVNDDFADASTLLDTATGTNALASIEPGEPLPPIDVTASVWWNWTAPETGQATISTEGSDFDTVLAVWTGDELTTLDLVAADDDGGAIGFTSRVDFAATAGETYRVAVYGYVGTASFTGDIELSVTLDTSTDLVNDDFADRLPLVDVTTGTNVGATVEADEPLVWPWYDCSFSSVWWSWTAPESGIARFSTAGSDFDTVIALWTGTSLADLEQVGANNDEIGRFTSLLEVEVTAGETYAVGVYGDECSVVGSQGSIDLSVEVGPVVRPTNDDFADAATLNATATGTNVAGTLEADEPGPGPYDGAAEASVWWNWTAPASGAATISTEGSNFDTILAVWTGDDLATLDLVGVHDDVERPDEPVFSELDFDAVAGETYRVAVYGFDVSRGEIVLSAVLEPAPVNDDFDAALPLVDTATGTNTGATLEPGEPLPSVGAPGASVWWTWTAPEAGEATLSTAGSDFDTVLAVWTGDDLTTLDLVAANDDFDGAVSRVDFDAAAGGTYHVAVYGYSGATGSIELSATVDSGGPPSREAVLVAGSTRPPAGDIAIADLVRAEGFELTIVDDDSDLAALDLSGVDLLLISTSVVPDKVGNVFADATVPIITWEPQLHDDLALSTAGGAGETSSTTRVEIVDPAHPLAAGLDGSPQVYTLAKTLSFGTPGAEADVIATAPGRPDQTVIFAYDAGDTLVDGSTAPAARVALFPSYGGARRLAPSGVDLISAALAWV